MGTKKIKGTAKGTKNTAARLAKAADDLVSGAEALRRDLDPSGAAAAEAAVEALASAIETRDPAERRALIRRFFGMAVLAG